MAAARRHGRGSYEVTFEGTLTQAALTELDHWSLVHDGARSRLRGDEIDQATLHGLVDRLELLGLPLVEVRHVAARRGSSMRG